MDSPAVLFLTLLAFGLGIAAAWLLGRLRLQAEVVRLRTLLDAERQAAGEKLRLLNEAEAKLSDAFKALSAEALKSNNESFLHLAKSALGTFQETARGDLEKRQQAIGELVKPLRESLDKVDQKIQEIETARAVAYSSLTDHLKGLAGAQANLERETTRLVGALRNSGTRGRWGEIQLQRVVEMAGMVAYCDFAVQATVTTEDGRQRPDLVVRLPNQKNIVIDAKAPLDAYLDALDAVDEDGRKAKLRDHARQIRSHLTKLAAKNYWAQFEPAPELVILFLPGETFFSAALEADPSLIEHGVEQRVILATPTTLIALLRAVAYGWRQSQVEENAKQISELGKTLYERLRTFASHLGGMGKSLGQSVDAYNKAVGSLEQRVLPAARRFKEMGAAGGDEIENLEIVDKVTRGVEDGETGEELMGEGVS
ncbi:MAG: recombination protein RmuC [Acidobacteriota bacterium]|jgi:DNA recombination protein RmuC|nr:recombination protein RmuC [Acidobacteriota bacterium]